MEARDTAAAAAPTLSLADVDAVLDAIRRTAGAGATRTVPRCSRALLGRATAAEQGFLVRLLFGELRQGAVEGVLARRGRQGRAAARRIDQAGRDAGRATWPRLPPRP